MLFLGIKWSNEIVGGESIILHTGCGACGCVIWRLTSKLPFQQSLWKTRTQQLEHLQQQLPRKLLLSEVLTSVGLFKEGINLIREYVEESEYKRQQ